MNINSVTKAEFIKHLEDTLFPYLPDRPRPLDACMLAVEDWAKNNYIKAAKAIAHKDVAEQQKSLSN